MNTVKSKYDEDSIQVLSDIEHIRKRPSMYLDSSRPTYHMFQEILDNSIDELMNGYADSININVDYESNSFMIQDNGRGIPQGLNKTLELPTPQVIYTTLNSGGKYDTDNYTCSAGTNGVGSVCVNALSKDFIVETWRDKSLVRMECSYGEVSSYEQTKTKRKGSGTSVFCNSDTKHPFIFDKLVDYRLDIEDRIYLLKTLFPNCHFVYNDCVIVERKFEDFIKEPNSPLLEKAIFLENEELKLAINWSKENNKYLTKCFCNSLYNPNGGDHEKGVYDAIAEFFGNTDYQLGISFAVSLLFSEVTYDTQIKLRACSKGMRLFVKEKVIYLLKSYMKKNPSVFNSIDELIKSKRKNLDKKNNKSSVTRNRRSTFLSVLGSSKFSDCSTKNREEAELFLTEGNSAAGSAIQARDIVTQAVMPLRGKIINALNSDIASLYKNAEVSTIMSSINIGTFNDVDIRKSRYGKIIIMADADEDGKNIACLLLSLFITMTPELVDSGMLYLSLPPLYGTYVKGNWIPINDEETKEKYMRKGYEIQRYKGLGECNPEQLRISCMDKNTRNILQINTTKDCYEIVKNIMGGSSSYRRDLLKEIGVLVD